MTDRFSFLSCRSGLQYVDAMEPSFLGPAPAWLPSLLITPSDTASLLDAYESDESLSEPSAAESASDSEAAMS